VKMNSISASRLISILAILAALGIGIGARNARASAEPAVLDAASSEFEARIEAMIHRWFAVLGDGSAEANALSSLLAEPTFELRLDGEVLRDRPGLRAWVSNLRATYPKIEYEIDPIRIDSDAEGLYHVHFEFDRRALDDAGFSHVARRKHTWIIQRAPNAAPVILEIKEQPLLFYSGTGPQVVCY